MVHSRKFQVILCPPLLEVLRHFHAPHELIALVSADTDETYTDAELVRVSVLTLDVTKTAYVSPVASNQKIRTCLTCEQIRIPRHLYV